jgi:hypothetical protein
MANLIYNSYRVAQLNGTIDLDTNTFKVMLVTSAYTPDAAHDFRNDITNEVVGAGYVLGGETLSTPTVTLDGVTADWDAVDVTWAASTITARGAVIYKNVGTAATDNLIAYIDFGTDQISSSGNFTIQWNAGGILTLS